MKPLLSTRPLILQCILLLCACVLLINTAQAKQLYKWVDENGDVQVSDEMPPEAVKKKHDVLNKQGLTIKNIGAAKTKEQLKDEEQQARLKQAEAAEKERNKREQAQRDAALLDTYLSEKDLLDTRNRQIKIIEDQIIASKNTLDHHKKLLAKLKPATANPSPGNAQNDLANSERQIVQLEKFINEKKQDQEQLRLKFENDLLRFRELTNR